jgi:hypothetical protein
MTTIAVAIGGLIIYLMFRDYSNEISDAAKKSGHPMCGMGGLYFAQIGYFAFFGVTFGSLIRALTLYLEKKKMNRAVIFSIPVLGFFVCFSLTTVIRFTDDFSFQRYEQKKKNFNHEMDIQKTKDN